MAKPTKPLKNRPQSERYEAHYILYGRKGKFGAVYDPEVHPEAIKAYFQVALDACQESERVETVHGAVTHVQPPVVPPTLGGFAAKMGVTRECVWSWEKKHPEFAEAAGIAKAMQEDVFLRMGALGAYPPGVTMMMMKNLHGWMDKIEQKHSGELTLTFDKQDEDA